MKSGADRTRVSWTNTRLFRVIQMAYDLLPDQISGPDWLHAEPYDILATMPEGTSEANFKLMVQNLLADRFKLAVHREVRQVPGYALEVASKGPKLKQSNGTASLEPAGATNKSDPSIRTPAGTFVDSSGFPAPLPDNPMFPPGTGFSATISVNGLYRATVLNRSMAEIARFLEPAAGMPVADQTGLAGIYDFHLEYKPDVQPTSPNTPSAGNNNDSSALVAPGNDLFYAVQSQLGLKLARKKVPRDTLVIEHIEKIPTEN